MKALKYFALAALAIGGLLLPLAATRPQSASADCGATFYALIPLGFITNCDPFDGPPPCTLGNVNAGVAPLTVGSSANGNRNSYTFDVNCDDASIYVTATYDLAAQRAGEKITSHEFNLSASWSCAHDPWIAPSPQVCTLTGVSGGTNNGGTVADIEGIDISQKTGVPYSARVLDDDARQVLFKAQLQYAANHSATPPPVKVVEATGTKSQDCALCTVLSQTSASGTGPADLAVSISGPTTRQTGLSGTYTVTIKNQGGSAAPVDLVIIFSGTLNQTDAVVAGAGLDCVVKAGDPGINQAVHCTSGSLAAVQSATVTVQARGQVAGKGMLLATINASRSVTESSYDNNLVQLDVTVG
jgi:hypothetical protein